jgi:hypothetical protein
MKKLKMYYLLLAYIQKHSVILAVIVILVLKISKLFFMNKLNNLNRERMQINSHNIMKLNFNTL